jgi:hypothetical protein
MRPWRRAGSTQGPKGHSALESLGRYDGLIKRYANPFTPDRHEARGPDDYTMAVWKGSWLELIGCTGVPTLRPRHYGGGTEEALSRVDLALSSRRRPQARKLGR